MSESTPVDPLTRYVDPSKLKDLRQALEDANAIVQGLWTLSTFCGPDETRLKGYGLSIVVYKDSKWDPIMTVLESDYQLRASPDGLRFCRKNGDDLLLKFHNGENLNWKDEKSLQKVVMREMMAQGLGCFMTSKYAVLFCSSQPSSERSDREIRQSIVFQHNSEPRGSAQRWEEKNGEIFSIMELSDINAEEDSFNWYISKFSILS
ncbi:hypothetical protein FOXYSP1_19464 [Fusarium oxysporum f. sp. phaseoli]